MKKFYDMMFTREPTNLGRQAELDITKTLCIFFMILLHLFEDIFLFEEEVNSGFGNFLMYYLAGFTGAGTFMLCMGLGFGYTRHNDPKDFIKRGGIIFGLSYLLNFLRAFTLIFFVSPHLGEEMGSYMITYSLFNVDIMQFAGLALMVFGLFKLAKMKPWHMFLIAFSLSLGASLFILLHGQVTTGNAIADGLLSLLFPMWFLEEGSFVSFFSLVCYLIFPITGYCISFYYKKLKNKNIFFGIALGLAVITIAIYVLINPYEKQAGLFRAYDIGYYHMYTWDALVDIITSTGLIALCYFASLILPKVILGACHDISKNINRVYCISWVILLNGIGIYYAYIYGKEIENPAPIPDWLIIILGIAVFFISWLIAHYYTKVKEIIKAKKKTEANPA